jgi:putative cardiolipin synthase
MKEAFPHPGRHEMIRHQNNGTQQRNLCKSVASSLRLERNAAKHLISRHTPDATPLWAWLSQRFHQRFIRAFWSSLLFATALLSGCTSLPTQRSEWNEPRVVDTTNTAWARSFSAAVAEHTNQSGIEFLAHGRDALASLLAVADTAERCLDAQYYIWKPDNSGRLLAERLLRAADRGVYVRLLLDDIGGSASDAVLQALDSHANIDVRLFNPVANRFFRRLSLLFDFQRVNRRMHNKSFTADRAITILGGRNIGDHYFAAGDGRQFADFDVVAAGPAAAEVAAMFDRYWRNPASIPIDALTRRRASPEQFVEERASLAAQIETLARSAEFANLASNAAGTGILRHEPNLVWGPVRLVADLPEKVERDRSDISTHLLPGLRDTVRATEREVFIVSPYFVPGPKGMEFFRSLRERGLRVIVLSNSLAANDVTPVHAGYRRYRKALLRAGVELWEIKPDVRMRATARDAAPREESKPAQSALHAKTFSFDRSTLFVGSLNLTPRSSSLNTEMGLLVEIPQLTLPALNALEKSLEQNAYRLEFVPGPGPCKECGSIVWVSQEDGREVRYQREPHASFGRRLQVNIFSLLPLESQL